VPNRLEQRNKKRERWVVKIENYPLPTAFAWRIPCENKGSSPIFTDEGYPLRLAAGTCSKFHPCDMMATQIQVKEVVGACEASPSSVTVPAATLMD
jgi:hypothetical protein